MTKDSVLIGEPMEVSFTPFEMIVNAANSKTSYFDRKLEEFISLYKTLKNRCPELEESLSSLQLDGDLRDALNGASLHVVVRHQHKGMVTHLLKNGTYVDAVDREGRTPLHIAASLGNFDIAQVLLQFGANPNAKSKVGFSVLFFAVNSERTDLVRNLAERGCNVNELVEDGELNRRYSYLHSAVERNSIAMVDTLIALKADVNVHDCFGCTPLHVAARDGHIKIAERLLNHGARVREHDRSGQTALSLAVAASNRALYQVLMRHGADPNAHGDTGAGRPLHLAVRQPDLMLVAYLLQHGAEVDAMTRFGRTALHYAIAERNWAAMELLLRYDADVNRRETFGKSPLHTVIETHRQEVLELLLRRGANPNIRDDNQNTPLHSAIREGCTSSVELLLRYGADPNIRDGTHQTPLHMAVRSGTLCLLELLLRHGADLNAVDAEGRVPLHLAVESEHTRLVYVHSDYTFFAALLERGADVEAGTENLLHLAVSKRCPTFVRSLLRKGADLHVRKDGRTPVSVALENHDVHCLEELLSAGADLALADQLGRRPNLAGHLCPAMIAAWSRAATRRSLAGLPYRRCTITLGVEGQMMEEKYRQICMQELRRISLTRLHGDATYLDLLRAGRRSLVILTRSVAVIHAFEGKVHRVAFPIYAHLLERNYCLGKKFQPILKPATDRLAGILKHRLPDLPLERVMEYLDAADMKNIIEAVPRLPVVFENDDAA